MLTHKSILRLTLFLFLNPLHMFGQDKTFKMIEYGVKDGLISSEVYHSIQSKSGHMWFATNGGISRYDGYEFKNFTAADGLIDNTIFRLYEDDWERIWYMTFQSGIGYIKNDKIHKYPYNAQLIKYLGSKYILEMHVDIEANIWFATHPTGTGKIDRFGNVEFDLISENSSVEIIRKKIGENHLDGILCNQKSAYGLMLSNENNGIKNLKFPIEKINISRKFPMENDTIYFSYRQNGIYYLANIVDSTMRTHKVEWLVNDIFLDEQNQLWICEQHQGVKVFENSQLFYAGDKPKKHILPEKNVSGITGDKNGGIWLATLENGIMYIPNPKITNFDLIGNAVSNEISNLAVNKKQELYFAMTSGELFKLNENQNVQFIDKLLQDIDRINFHNDLDLIEILYISDAKVHDSLDQTQQSGATYSFKTFKGRDAFTRKNGNTLVIKTRHIREIGTNGINKEYGNGFYYSIIEDSERRVWVGGKEGLFRLEQDQLLPIRIDTNRRKNPVVNIIKEYGPNKLIVFSVSDGLFIIDVSDQPHLDKRVPLETSQLNEIYISPEKDVWLSSDLGVILIHFRPDGSYTKTRMTEKQGLASSQVNDIKTIEDTVFVATDKGLSQFHKLVSDDLNKVPNLTIDGIKINESSVPLQADYELKYNENRLQLNYTAIAFNTIGSIKYAYYLQGVDSRLHSSTNRVVRYPDLAPGTYTFFIKASGGNGKWSDFKKIHFSIDAPYWQKWWFVGSLIFAGLLLTFLYISSREKKLKRDELKLKLIEINKRKLVESELRLIRAQLNPHFIFNTLNSIQSYITNLNAEKASDYIAKFAHLMRVILENGKKESVSLHEEIKMLSLYVEIQNMRFDNPIDFFCDIKDNIELQKIRVPTLILQPIIENSILHGLAPKMDGDRKLELTLKKDLNQIICTITDNGIGRKQAEVNKRKKGVDLKTSIGLKMTRDRLAIFYKNVNNNRLLTITDLYERDGAPKGTRTEIYFFMNS